MRLGKSTKISAAILSITSMLAGCSSALPPTSEQILEHGDRYEVMYIHSIMDKYNTGPFHGCVIDKTVVVSDIATQKKLIRAIEQNLSTDGLQTLCMSFPRYGLHIVRAGHTLDLTICFHCFKCEVYESGKPDTFLYPDESMRPTLEAILN